MNAIIGKCKEFFTVFKEDFPIFCLTEILKVLYYFMEI